LDEEIQRIREMPEQGSFRAVWDLYVEVKLHVLQTPDRPLAFGKKVIDFHDMIDEVLSDAMRGQVGCSFPSEVDKSQEDCYVDAAKACREIRAYIDRYRCRFESDACPFNALVPTLDTLQRHAYEEIRHKVHIALRGRLPSELTMTIFEQAMLGEDVPLDPRVSVNARHAVSGTQKRKTRLICEHVARHMPDEPRLTLAHGRGYLVADPEWIELKPRCSHYNDWARAGENADYVR
jgi:hypothetical protein